MQKHVNLVDLVKSFPTHILLQNLASIQKRASPVKFAHLAEKSGKGSISNLSTKNTTASSAPKMTTVLYNSDQLSAARRERSLTGPERSCAAICTQPKKDLTKI